MRQDTGFSAQPETAWRIIRRNKLACLAALAIGGTLPFGLKYVFAAILIAFLVAGGSQ